jgi:hypothetical protein
MTMAPRLLFSVLTSSEWHDSLMHCAPERLPQSMTKITSRVCGNQFSTKLYSYAVPVTFIFFCILI